MLVASRVEVGPGVDPHHVDTYQRIYDDLEPRLETFFETGNTQFPFLASNQWVDMVRKGYPDLEIRSLTVLFDRKLGQLDTTDLLVVKFPLTQDFLGIDVGSPCYGFGGNEIPAAIGRKPFVVNILNGLYAAKFPGIHLSAPGQKL